jgi:hypothetical protein
MQVVKKNVTLAYFNLYLQMFLDCQNQLNYSFFNLLLKGVLGLKLLMRTFVGNFMNTAADALVQNNMKQMVKYVQDTPTDILL